MAEAAKKTDQDKLEAAQLHWLKNQDDPKALKALLDAEARVADAPPDDTDAR